jgi:hypothetical protein
LAYLLPVVLDRAVQVVVRGLAPGEVEQAISEACDRVPVSLALVREFAEDVDHGPGSFGRRCPEVEGELAAQQVEVEIDKPLRALTGEVTRDAVRAGKLRGHVLDDGSLLLDLALSVSAFGLSLLEGLGVALGLAMRHKVAPPSPV